MTLIGDVFSTGDGLTLGVSLVLLEIPDEPWIKASIINALNTMTIEANWSGDNGDITPEQAQQIASLMLQTILFGYEPPVPMIHPIGSIIMFPANEQPEGWYICDGQELSRSAFAELFALIGTNYGAGNGTTTFNIPNWGDLSPMGVGSSIVTGVGGTAGTALETLSTTQIPSHVHSVSDPGHNHALTDPGHVHRERVGNGASAFILGAGGGSNPTVGSGVTTGTSVMNTGSATTGISNNVAFTGASITATGGGESHNNVHPVMGTYFLIYAGV